MTFGRNQPDGLFYIPYFVGRAIGSALKAFRDAYDNAVGHGDRRASVGEQRGRQHLRVTIGWLAFLFGFFEVQIGNVGVGSVAWRLGILLLPWRSRWSFEAERVRGMAPADLEAVTNTAKRTALNRAGLKAKQAPPWIWSDFEEAIRRNRAAVWRSCENL